MFKRIRIGVVVFLVAFVSAALEGHAQTVVNRARLGNNTEDITFISSGPFANQVAIMDGHEVLGVQLRPSGDDDNDDDDDDSGPSCPSVRKLFDVRGLAIEGAPRGIAYIKSERLFAFNDAFNATQRTLLFFSDHRGKPQGVRTIQYLGPVPQHLEGLAYLPPESSFFPDHLVMVGVNFGGPTAGSRLHVLRLDGQVVAEIVPDEPLGSSFIGGLGFIAPDHLVVSICCTGDPADNSVWEIDFAGNVLRGPIVFTEGEDVEGLVQLPNGRIVAATYAEGTLFSLDEELNRRPQEDRFYRIGIGLSRPIGVAWNTDTDEHVFAGVGPGNQQVAAVPPSLDARRSLADLAALGLFNPRGATYLPDEHLIAVAHRGAPRAILLFDNSGTLVEQIDVSAFGLPGAVTYIPTTQQFAVRFSEQPTLLRILTRAGALARTIDLTPTGITVAVGVAFFNPAHPSGGQFLILDPFATDRALITDFNGNLLSEFNFRTALEVLAPSDVSAITTGPEAGSFALIDGVDNSEIVVFRLE